MGKEVSLLPFLQHGRLEAGCDEAGRGPLAGPVHAAAVILPEDFHHPLLNDSKQLTEKKRYALRTEIERDAVAWAVGIVTPEEMENAVFTDDKQTRESNVAAVTEKLREAFAENEEWLAILDEAVYQYEKKTVRKMILKDHKRPDGRALDQIRPLFAEVDLIPRVHGSAMFTRGQTQICDVVTLAPLSEAQRVEGLDPNITETFDVYASLADQIASLDVDQDTLNGYILSSYAYYARSSGELTGALNAAMTLLEGKTQEQTIEYMQQLKALTPESVKASADLFRKLSENGVHSTAGSASAVQAHADLYEVVLNPFNAADASSIELTDAPEDSAYYTAVRFAFEEGLMAPAEENAFGVDQPATVGDLAGAIYVLIGGSLGDAQEAIATLGAYGIVSPDAQADTALTQGDADAILVNLMAAMGAEGAYTPSAENADLPLTRGALAELLHTLFSE